MSKLTAENETNMLSNLLSEENVVSEISKSLTNEKPDQPKTISTVDQAAEPSPIDPVENKDETTPVIPELTKYEVTFKCCCFDPFAKIKIDDKQFRSFWGSHELDSICMNVFVSGIILFVELVHFFIIFPRLGYTRNDSNEPYHYDRSRFYSYQLPCLISHFITLILFLWSYFGAACMDPGFLPYNWIETRKTKYKWDEQLSGLAITQEQVQYGLDHRPNMASFSKSAGRFVIRADHICVWIGNWVGKRNHKQFILMNLWGSFYSLNLFSWHIPILKQIFPSDGKPLFFLYILFIFFETFIELIFGFVLFYVFIINLDDLRKDLTKIKKWKNENGQEYSCLKAMREVCGPGNICCFAFPTPAFGDVIIFDENIPEDPDNINLE